MSPTTEPLVPVEAWERLGRYIGSGAAGVDPEVLKECAAAATGLVMGYVGRAAVMVPEPILDLSIVQVGSELFARREAPSGVPQFADGGQSPVRLARDPMTSTYPLLRRYVRGIA